MIELQHLTKRFATQGGTVVALNDINLTIRDGDVYGIIGMSGAGKSTLVRCINMLERPDEGNVIVNGKQMQDLRAADLRAARREITMIFQQFNLLMQRTCLRNIMFPMELAKVPKEKAEARARELLGAEPRHVLIEASGNIIKNVKSVIVPHTGSMHGIAAAAAAGIIAGREDRELEVLSEVTQAQIEEMRAYLKEAAFEIRPIDSPFIFDIRITVCADGDQATARIVGSHTNLVQLLHGTTRIIDRPCSETVSERRTDRSILTVERIVDFADSLCPEDVQELFERQISYNMAIAEAGLSGSYGANVGRTLREAYGETVNNRARYMAAAASDARMSGCELPVIINSGSGNQGITASVPVVVYAQELGVSRETLYRALAVSNLSTIHIKAHIGTLSAYCGAVSAGCGAGAGITYLYGGGYEHIKHTLVNAMAITSGIICDGAKPSCAAKIATSVDAGLLGYHMYRCGNQFYAGDGIVKSGIEHTIETVGTLAHTGMADTDRQIVRLMMED